MTYLINRADGTLLLALEEGFVDSSKASITFIGRTVLDYGEIQNETFLHLLENFSNTAPPDHPLSGQLWFDSTASVLRLSFYDGQNWQRLSTIQYASTATNQTSGDFWWDSTNHILYIKTGDTYSVVGGGNTGTSTALVYISDVAPVGVPAGSLWWNDVDGRCYILYNGQWIELDPDTGGGALDGGYSGYSGTAGYSGADGISGYSGTTGYSGVMGFSGYSGAAGGGGGTYVYVGDDPPVGAPENSLWWCTLDGRCYILYYGQWVELDPDLGGGGSSSLVYIGDDPPLTAAEGQLWWNDVVGKCYIFYNGQWVIIDANDGMGGAAGSPAPTVQFFIINEGRTGSFNVRGINFKPRAVTLYASIGSVGTIRASNGFAGPGGAWDILTDTVALPFTYTPLINGSHYWSINTSIGTSRCGPCPRASSIYIVDDDGVVVCEANVTAWNADGCTITMTGTATQAVAVNATFYP